ncbi:hypothetical protein [Streptomyces sp. H27-C3]|uniref:hypothetical protein n=1 Tax=Streptomyces sp. H27-C3 TaxID=3046305 RepID=UPI0024BBB5D8|nr:hypothetical protein [Streptomyces sp. H27-C3]MDJ0460645.1 hypothetical protein [Streptomyces sp. H27-C3]
MSEFTASVREVQHQVRIDLTGAPKITNGSGQTRKPQGLRVTYGRRRDIDRVDLVVEYADSAERVPPADGMPDWVSDLVAKHQPADVDEPDAFRPPGSGGMSIPAAQEKGTATAATSTPQPDEQIVYRAGYQGDLIPLGLYTTTDAARAHCEAQLSAEYPAHVTVIHDWIGDDSDPLEPFELVAEIDGATEQPTGYVVTPLLVAAEYDAEADA